MADTNILPGPRSWPNMPPEWFRFFRELQTTVDTEPEPPVITGFVPDTTVVAGGEGVKVIGTLASGFIGISIDADAAATFETVSKNLRAWAAEFAYSVGILQTITYTDSLGTVVKTFGYTGDQLTTLTLSGDTPSGIDLIKTLTYTGDELTSVAYS